MMPHYVYVLAMKCGDGYGPVKIGISRNPQERSRGLSTGSPYPLVLIHSVAFPSLGRAKEAEAALHRGLASKRLNGEWFDIEPSYVMRCLFYSALSFRRASGRISKKEIAQCRSIASRLRFREAA